MRTDKRQNIHGYIILLTALDKCTWIGGFNTKLKIQLPYSLNCCDHLLTTVLLKSKYGAKLMGRSIMKIPFWPVQAHVSYPVKFRLKWRTGNNSLWLIRSILRITHPWWNWFLHQYVFIVLNLELLPQSSHTGILSQISNMDLQFWVAWPFRAAIENSFNFAMSLVAHPLIC